jgi:hypothetical protein
MIPVFELTAFNLDVVWNTFDKLPPGIKTIRFQDRLFLFLDSSQLEAIRLHLRYANESDWEENSIVVTLTQVDWMRNALAQCSHYPVAHKQLQYAQTDNLSVEHFLSNLASAFAEEWRQGVERIIGLSRRVEEQCPKP